MVQLSSFSLYPATQGISTLPDLTVKLTPKGPIATEQPDGRPPQYGIQFNFMGLKGWNQFVFLLGYPSVYSGPTPPPVTDAVMSYGLDSMATEIEFTGSIYVDLQPSPAGAAFATIPVDPARWNAGLYYIELTYRSGAIGITVASQADGSPLWSVGPILPQDPSVLPSVLGVQMVGRSGGGNATFLRCDAALEISAAAPVYFVMTSDATVWSYDDGTDGVHPLLIANETGESSNLWTNVIGQNSSSVTLELSLVKGNQAFSNPPLAGTLKDPVLTLKVSQ